VRRDVALLFFFYFAGIRRWRALEAAEKTGWLVAGSETDRGKVFNISNM
jgi:hypothetical protein